MFTSTFLVPLGGPCIERYVIRRHPRACFMVFRSLMTDSRNILSLVFHFKGDVQRRLLQREFRIILHCSDYGK